MKNKIALVIETEPKSGGAFFNLINLIKEIKKITTYEFIIVSLNKKNNDFLKNQKIDFLNFNFGKFFYLFEKIRYAIRSFLIDIRAYKYSSFLKDNRFENFFKKKGVDLVIFFGVSDLSLYLKDINYVNCYLDSCHLENPEFPEVKSLETFFKREKNYKNILSSSVFILSGSKECTNELSINYNIKSAKVVEFPYLPQDEFSNEGKTELNNFDNKYLQNFLAKPKKYIFYPANYWSHKNHIYIMKSLKKINLKQEIPFSLIFCGADKSGFVSNNKSYLIKKSKELEIKDNILFLSHVSNKDLINLYKNSFALVMPTYFGPINIPPIEAHKYGVPVIYSKQFANLHYDFDYQIPIDLEDNQTLIDAIESLQKDKDLRNKLINNGKKFYEEILKTRLKFLSNFEKKIDQFFYKRETWE